MSHNKIKVAGQALDTAGRVNLSTSNLSDIAYSSLSSNDLIEYNGSSYENVAKANTLLVAQSLFANNNNTATGSGVFNFVFTNSTSNDNTANSLFVDAQSSGYGIADITGSLDTSQVCPSGLQIGSNGKRFYCKYEVPTGQYILVASTRGFFQDSTGNSLMSWMDENYNVLGNAVEILPASGGQRGSKKIFGYVNTNTTIHVHLGFISTSKHARAREANGTTVQILRIGDYQS